MSIASTLAALVAVSTTAAPENAYVANAVATKATTVAANQDQATGKQVLDLLTQKQERGGITVTEALFDLVNKAAGTSVPNRFAPNTTFGDSTKPGTVYLESQNGKPTVEAYAATTGKVVVYAQLLNGDRLQLRTDSAANLTALTATEIFTVAKSGTQEQASELLKKIRVYGEASRWDNKPVAESTTKLLADIKTGVWGAFGMALNKGPSITAFLPK